MRINVEKKTDFDAQVINNIAALGKDNLIKELSWQWMKDSACHNYVYNFHS